MIQVYQIDNVISYIFGIKQHIDLSVIQLSQNPLGDFKEMQLLKNFAGEEFYRLVQEILVDMPVGEYFQKFIETMVEKNVEEGGDGHDRGIEEISKQIEDPEQFKSQELKMILKKIWLTKFHRWIMAHCDDATREIMDDLLKSESDWETI